ncbi:MAG: ABC transporter ATP-binding protein [Treponema sp.]|jgi:peptide/nickel transport system ATP-binding protein|nr:ABC transporter ATP-binding protein [Treponema sp.]
MALLEVRNLSVGIKKNKSHLAAVDGISFDIEAGEIIGLVGESGCGKTLSALSIPGLLPPEAEVTGGSLSFGAPGLCCASRVKPPKIAGEAIFYPANSESAPDNRDFYVTGDAKIHKYNRLPEAGHGSAPAESGEYAAALDLLSLDEEELCRIRGKDISMIFQEPRQSLNPLLRAGDQITEALKLHGLAETKTARRKALELIEKLGLNEPERVFASYPHQLSGGMCQRVMIAIAAICRPRLLIADEPTTALDPAVQLQILGLLEKINRGFGTAILFISHDLSLVRRFCARTLVMYAGKIVEEGKTGDLFSDPRHPYTRGLIGAVPLPSRRGRPLANIPGRAPSIEDKIEGCPFAPRCPRAEPACRAAFPAETDLGGNHRVNCPINKPAACAKLDPQILKKFNNEFNLTNHTNRGRILTTNTL